MSQSIKYKFNVPMRIIAFLYARIRAYWYQTDILELINLTITCIEIWIETRTNRMLSILNRSLKF